MMAMLFNSTIVKTARSFNVKNDIVSLNQFGFMTEHSLG